MDNNKLPRSVRAARVLFFLLAAIWIFFAIITLAAGSLDSALTLAALMLVNAAVLAFTGWGLGKQDSRYLLFGLVVLAGNIFLTITDEFGWFDLIVLVLYGALLILLLTSRANYKAPNKERDMD